MFDVMEKDLMTWKEKLDLLKVGGQLPLETRIKGKDKVINPQSVYSAIRLNKEHFKSKSFSIRRHPVTKINHVIRKK